VVPQLLTLAVSIGIFSLSLGFGVHALLWGAGCYLAYSFGSRAMLLRHHNAGMAALHQARWGEAIVHFRASFEFFSEHSWIDRYRAITMMSPSAASYREMALLNVAFCHAQLGNGPAARAAYERVSREFPDSPLAKSTLRLIESVAQESSGGGGEHGT
jgi:hypothetical protein